VPSCQIAVARLIKTVARAVGQVSVEFVMRDRAIKTPDQLSVYAPVKRA